ncbi:MAG: hypothetical protein PHW01_00255 [Patescibacteria group bacterium]|nr:hypothetical protein [Patescibacteria group bacterium]
MYVKSEDLSFDILYQGDVIKNAPFFIFEDELRSLKNLKKTNTYEAIKIGEKSFNNGEALLAINAKLNNIIILSQTCDVQDKENIIIAPVYPIKLFEDNGILTDGKAGLIKKRKINYWFYLPELEGIIGDSLVDFLTIHYIPKTFLEKYKSNKIITMTDWGRHHLGWALSNYFGRPIEDKNS